MLQDNKTTTSTSMILRMGKEDPDAWSRFVFLYRPLILFWCQKEGVMESDCEDVIQNVFQTVHKYIKSYNKTNVKGAFRNWLRLVSYSRIRDFQDGIKNVVPPLTDTSLELLRKIRIPTVDEPTERQIQMRQAMESVKARVKPDTYTAFMLTTILMEDSVTVAEKLGMKPENVRKAKQNVLRLIKEEFEDLLD